MLDMLEQILIRQCKLVPNQPVLVGVSGGPDSLCLVDVLNRLGYQIIGAHLDHKLRPESRKEADEVSQIVEAMGISLIRSEADVYEYAQVKALSIEEAARELRYEFLFSRALEEKTQAVAVGHNADDQVETVLMHLIRGSGVAGLRGMSFKSLPNAWSHEIPLVRPLLGIWREEVLRYCNDRDLIPMFDSSNLDKTYFRNRLRHELIPTLTDYNPRIKEIIFRSSEIISEDYEIISNVVDTAWEKCLYQVGDGYLALQIDFFQKQRLGVQRHLIRKSIAYHRPDLRDIDFDTVERALSFLDKPTETFQRDLVAGLMLYMEGNVLWIHEQNVILPGSGFPLVPENAIIKLHIPGALELEKGWVLQGNISNMSDSLMEKVCNNDDPFTAFLDKDKLISSLHIRTRQPGDRFQPLGMNGNSIKISDFMINMKIPRRIRDRWPLICSEDIVVWLPGYRIHHAYRITYETKSVVILKLNLREQTGINLG